jgi:phage gp29-like protein
MRGALGAITPWWLARHYALRDWARYSERHGLPMIKALTPAVGDPRQQAVFRSSLATLGQETVLHLPQNPAPQLSYDVQLLEARDTAHAGFQELIERCDIEITLSLLAQNLTSEVKEGSFAAARVHADVRQSLLECDARALAEMVYRQIARPFAAMNFGNPDLAPRVIWNVKPYEDDQTAAATFKTLADGLFQLRQAGFEPKDVKDVVRLADSFGLKLGRIKASEPLQVEAQAARAGGQVRVEKVKQEGADARARIAAPRMRVAQERDMERQIALHRELLATIEAEQEAAAEEHERAQRRRRRAA